MNLHHLTSEDLPLMDGLLHLFAEAFHDHETYTGNPPDADYLRRLLDNQAFIAVVATKDDQVIGAITAYVMQKYEQARSEIYIYDLAVDASHRRQGVATALIGEVRALAAKRGAWVVYIQADTGEEDQPAIALYSKLGRREEVLHFDLDPIPRAKQ